MGVIAMYTTSEQGRLSKVLYWGAGIMAAIAVLVDAWWVVAMWGWGTLLATIWAAPLALLIVPFAVLWEYAVIQPLVWSLLAIGLYALARYLAGDTAHN